MSQLRFKVVDEAFNRKAEPVEMPKERTHQCHRQQGTIADGSGRQCRRRHETLGHR